MTDREKLIELLHKGVRCPGTVDGWGCSDCPHHSDDDPCDEYGATADMLIAHGVTVQEWISVEDKLPEECGRFLVCGSRGGIYTAEFRKDGDFGGEYPHWHKLNSKSHHCEPTHWMPLPKLPKEVFVYIAHRGSGKVLWEEELRRRAIEKGKTVLVMRKEDCNAKRHN